MSRDEEQSGGERAILLVEDEQSIREALRELLEDEGYLVFEACHGEEALALLPTLPSPLLMILDLMMPVMNGWELLRRLQGEPRHPGLSVIAVSAATKVGELPGVAHLLRKPLNFDRLLTLVRQLLG